MNKTNIRNFAIWARRKLISDITYKAGMIGITENGIADKLPQSTADLHFFDIGTKNYSEVSGVEIKQRDALINAICEREHSFKSFKEAFENTVEEVAYTWFNRLIAIRFMEVNEYLPSGVRVLSSENKSKNEPDFVTSPFDTDLDFTPYEQDRVFQLKDENKLDELFRMLFIKQCNKLNCILPDLFEKTDDYTELLLTISFTDKDGVVYRLVHDIAEDDFDVEKEGQIEIIGWLYQYYNSELKDDTFAKLKKNIKIEKDRIPAATQLFTPDWIVRYMVENSLGRLWLDGHPDSALRAEMPYYLEEAEQEESVRKQLDQIKEERKRLSPEQIRVIDPCMGSGHILVYAFDLLMKIYLSCGYSERDAVINIITKNIWGLELDRRAYQLAYFAVMMTAQKYDKRFLARIRDRKPNQKETDGMPDGYLYTISHFQGLPVTDGTDLEKPLRELVLQFKDADTYGSLISVKAVEGLDQAVERFEGSVQSHIYKPHVDRMMRLYNILSQKYDVVCTNPPYMAVSNANAKVQEYVKRNFPDSKSDMFAVFIERCGMFAKQSGYQAMITQHAWMFLSSFEKLRTKLLAVDTVNMAHLGARAFEEIGGEVVQTTSFVIRRSNIPEYAGLYCRLIEPTTQKGKEDMFLSDENRYTAKQSNFSKIPGAPIAYWVSEKIVNTFLCDSVNSICSQKTRISTGDNERFMRKWYEVSYEKMMYPNKWVLCPKGGDYRKWYGNIDFVLNWHNNGEELKAFSRAMLGDANYFFKEGLTWTVISSNVGFRIVPEGAICDHKGPLIYVFERSKRNILIGLLNSRVSETILEITAPTIGIEWGAIAKIPLKLPTDPSTINAINDLVEKNISLSRDDWDSFETSWDFKAHSLAAYRRDLWDGTAIAATISHYYGEVKKVSCPLELCWLLWQAECGMRFEQLKKNEEELNRIFIDIYGLQDELTPEVDDKDVTVRKADLQRDIRSFISYAVGCMFGRYSLDKEGLILAGQDFGSVYAKNPQGYSFGDVVTLSGSYIHQRDGDAYSWQECSFFPDEDNCIPITDDEYFTDDIVGRFVEFVKVVYGEESLEDNLRFIANALGNKGGTSREVIRNYFLNDFYADHLKIYQKRPIYWLFDSGKKNGFKALVYMQRWNADTTGNMRVEYLHRMQKVYEKEIERMQETIENSHDNKEISNAVKRQEKLRNQLKETKDYDALVAHLALSRIDIDLDDGVKVNYEKVQTASDGRKMQVLAKI